MSGPDAKRCCPECGLELPPHGGCPHCLLRLALGGEGEPTDSPPSPPPAGLQSRFFGDYEILNEISRGGMGVVYRARHLGLKRLVALKMIQSSQLLSPEARLRFSMEVAAVAQLNHPHIVALYESGEFKGTHFFTMRLVEGGTLAQQIKAARSGLASSSQSAIPALGSSAAVASWQQHRGEDGDNRDDHQQLDEREGACASAVNLDPTRSRKSNAMAIAAHSIGLVV